MSADGAAVGLPWRLRPWIKWRAASKSFQSALLGAVERGLNASESHLFRRSSLRVS